MEKTFKISIAAYFLFSYLVTPVWAVSHDEVVLLHHSTGGNLYTQGDLPGELADLDGTIQISEIDYPTSRGNYPYDYWDLWVNGACDNGNPRSACLDYLSQNYDVVIFKHCYPGSDIVSSGSSPSDKTLANYKSQYRDLRDKFDQYPNTIFIVWTLVPRNWRETNQDNADRAREFTNWVRDVWPYESGSHPNLYVWDFFDLIAKTDNPYDSNCDNDGGCSNRLKAEYEQYPGSTDSHPNRAANEMAAPKLAQFVVDSINDFEGGSPPPTATPTPTPDPIADILAILANWGNSGGDEDINKDGKVNGVDFGYVVRGIMDKSVDFRSDLRS